MAWQTGPSGRSKPFVRSGPNTAKPKKKFSPSDKPLTAKYGGQKGWFTYSSLRVPSAWPTSELLSTLTDKAVTVLNNGVSNGTWGNYSTAVRHLMRCQQDTGVPMNFPLSPPQLVVYMSWLLMVRAVQPETVKGYLSGLRMAHIASGVYIHTLHSPIIDQFLTGAANIANIEEDLASKPYRKAVTLPLLLLISHKIKTSEWSKYKQQLVWSVCLLAFHGAFRCGELLASNVKTFDSKFHLLRRDITMLKLVLNGAKVSVARVRVKSPKTGRVGLGQEVEVFQLQSKLCPIAALCRFWEMSDGLSLNEPNQPAFRREDGFCYTKTQLNADLKSILADEISYETGASISCHSFRAGLSSHMSQWNFSKEDIQGWGRWTSDAYERYCKLPSTARRLLALRLNEKFESHLSNAQSSKCESYLG